MGGNVFANGLEISGKAVDAKTIAAMPDVCFTPPENPATPPGVPIPYPSFGMASDTESGTATVLISGKIVNIKNKSDEKKTSGTEAGCAAKKGVITSKNTGKKYFNSWSTDVKFEGEPVIRFSDIATHNHASPIGNAPPWPEVAQTSLGSFCAKVYAKYMTKYDPNQCKTPEYQAHHIIDNASFARPGARAKDNMSSFVRGPTLGERAWKVLRNLFQSQSPHPGKNYHEGDAPSICLRGNRFKNKRSQHAKAHNESDQIAKNHPKAPTTGKWTYKEARQAGLDSIKAAVPSLTKAELECIGLMLDAYYKDEMGCTDSTEVRAPGIQPSTGQTFATGHGQNAAMSPRPP